MEDVTFTISAEHGTTLTSLNGTQTGLATGQAATLTFTRDTADSDSLDTTVINQKGTVLPETGGMGTTIFYAVGTVMVLGAAIVMVTRKRMSA
jgi:LPXTG-motif cell wall-anchored protein